jgi:hypothetical protein
MLRACGRGREGGDDAATAKQRMWWWERQRAADFSGGATSRRHAHARRGARAGLFRILLNTPALLRCIFRVAGDVDRCSKHSSSPERQSELTVRTAEPRARC